MRPISLSTCTYCVRCLRCKGTLHREILESSCHFNYVYPYIYQKSFCICVGIEHVAIGVDIIFILLDYIRKYFSNPFVEFCVLRSQVESETQFERVGSSTLGGSSFWGLGSLLTGAEDFGELCGLVEADQRIGTTYNIERIYGSDHKNISSSLERSPGSTPKFTHLVLNAEGTPQATQIPASVKPDTCGDDLKLEDNVSRSELAMSLLRMISSDIAQLASLYALSQEIKRVYFTGYFLRSRPMSIHLLRSALHYWSKEQVEPHFFRHEGYLGAIGALSACVDADADTDEQKHFHMASWEENYACSALPDEPLGVQSHVAFDRIDCALVSFIINIETCREI